MNSPRLIILLLSLLSVFAQAGDNVMKPFYGTWEVDVKTTVEENFALPPELVAAMKKDLTDFPFTLTITDHQYISKSRVKTMTDEYRVGELKGERVTLELLGRGDDPSHRQSTLSLRNGMLYLRTAGNQIVVVLRPSPVPPSK